jgi:methyl-accepting chemotaxis protein
MRISTKLIAITLASAVIVGGLVTSLVLELRSVATGYNAILQGPVNEAAAARRAQVDFSLEIRDWKDVLLRGGNSGELARYTLAFHDQEAKVKAEVAALAGSSTDPATRELLKEFLTQDDALSAKYQAGLGVYIGQGFDFKAADTLVRGVDRGPNLLLGKILTQQNDRIAAEAAAQRAGTLRQLMLLLIVVGGIVLVDTVLYCSVLFGVIQRLGKLKAVADRLAVADLEGLSIDISGHDEIGAIGESLKGVEAALHELLVVHAH